MNFDKIFFVAGILFLLLFFVTRSRKKKYAWVLPALAIFFLFIPSILPNQLFGKWDAIKDLKDKEIKSVILKPSLPGWEVNLVDSAITVISKSQIKYLSDNLHKVQVQFPSRRTRIWETQIIFITSSNDSLSIKIEKLEKDGAVIYTDYGEFKRDGLAEYLEKIVKFNRPVKGR